MKYRHKIRLNTLWILQHFPFIGLLYNLSTPDTDIFIVLSLIAVFCMPWQHQHGKHLQWMSDKCSSGGSIWPRYKASSTWSTSVPQSHTFPADVIYGQLLDITWLYHVTGSALSIVGSSSLCGGTTPPEVVLWRHPMTSYEKLTYTRN